jgi:hypothetical protein
MVRKVAGAWVLGLTVVAMLFSLAFIGPRSSGAAARAPVPEPPPVGACVRLPDVTVVPCSAVHDAEVTGAWSAGMGQPLRGDPYIACNSTTDQYLGAATASPVVNTLRWTSPGLGWETVLAWGPGQGDRIPGFQWQVCLVQPSIGSQIVTAGWTGSLPADAAADLRPIGLRWCYVRAGGPMTVGRCDQPHVGELLATTDVQLPLGAPTDAPLPASVLAGCRAQVTQRTGLADPTVGGRLAVQLTQRELGVGSVTGPTGSTTFQNVEIGCALEAVGAHQLTGSVQGLDGAAVPLQ